MVTGAAALFAAAEAVTLLRRLAAEDPDRHHPNLAAAFDNLGVNLGRLGRRREALDAAAQAVELYRRLTLCHEVWREVRTQGPRDAPKRREEIVYAIRVSEPSPLARMDCFKI
ncbi:MAG: tetratricopeptide repeat protein [Egibacteraceae bacterium]